MFFLDKIAHRYLSKLLLRPQGDVKGLHLLTSHELLVIRTRTRKTLMLSACFGVIGVLLLYAPQWAFPAFFDRYSISLFGWEPFSWLALVYGIILAYLEILAITYIHIIAVYKIAEICDFPDKLDPEREKYIEALLRVGLERQDKTKHTLGLNPWQGVSRFGLFLFTVFNRLRATLSNIFAKMILRRMLGRYALREIIDLVGIPVFAFWNAYGSYTVIHETKIRILAPNVIRFFVLQLKQQFAEDQVFKSMLYDTLQFIAMAKRNYHQNHLLLAKVVLEIFELPTEREHPLNEDYVDRLKKLTPAQRQGLARLIAIGFIIDGRLSMREERMLTEWYKSRIIFYKPTQIKGWVKSYASGRGVKEFMEL